jgi:hypothetical protein
LLFRSGRIQESFDLEPDIPQVKAGHTVRGPWDRLLDRAIQLDQVTAHGRPRIRRELRRLLAAW